MTKYKLTKLRRGVEVFNSDTGEVARLTALLSGGSLLLVEVMDSAGRFHCWQSSKVERI